MLYPKNKLQEIEVTSDLILAKIYEFEAKYKQQIDSVHPNYTNSAKNLIHYLALRSFSIDILQKKIDEIGLPNSPEFKGSILHRILSFKTIINSLLKTDSSDDKKIFLTNKEAKKIQKENFEALFGKIKNKRKTAIMVTQPLNAASDAQFTKSLIDLGMDCARINCAHDDETTWKSIINNIRAHENNCKITMDLAGPKIRTGKMKPGHKVIHIKPKKNDLGKVVAPAKIWMAPYGTQPPQGEEADAIIPINKNWLQKTQIGSYIIFKDSRGKRRKIIIDKLENNGRWGNCKKSAFIVSGTSLNVFFGKGSASEKHTANKLLPLEEVIFLSEGDLLRLDKEPILGEPALYDQEGSITEMAHVSCTLPEVFNMVNEKEQIYFDDGKIEGVIKEIQTEYLIIEITGTKSKGGKLRADKGINLPKSKLSFSELTDKDKKDLQFVVKNADVVNFSFINDKQDIENLLNELKSLNANIGIILKIETQEAYKNLPGIILKAMENYPIGVMIARGDLAIETGWENFAIIQEEILQLCESAHLPDIWATQVLENMIKKGIPTRAEITDAAMAQRAECVMLNKGPYIEKAVKMLDKILCKMQHVQRGNKTILPKLKFNEDL
ncbi:MAG: hypothetical protein K8F54_10305 [Altibacter sp.]|uniref:pyruvate kinase n=1 Tax=Altibacter sp. TaxID=2024823 RepID=UPI001D233544|nr:pyruvate kinase [Altibacter sp.]MBZ0327985.1 hypothetical protein [Altibacter sp.]